MVASDLTAARVATASAALASQSAAAGRPLPLRARALVVVENGCIPGTSWYPMMYRWPTITSPHLAAACGPEPLSRDGWDIDGGLYKAPRDESGRIVMDWRSMGQVP